MEALDEQPLACRARTGCRSEGRDQPVEVAPASECFVPVSFTDAGRLVDDTVDAAVLLSQVAFVRGPLAGRKPCGVGLCWTMKLYQSRTQTFPSGPTSAMIGAAHSSSEAIRLNGLDDRKLLPSGRSTNVPTKCPVGSQTNAVRFQ